MRDKKGWNLWQKEFFAVGTENYTRMTRGGRRLLRAERREETPLEVVIIRKR